MSRHSFDPEIAKQVGINAAVIYQNILWWAERNAANNKHNHEGLWWTYNSVSAFAELFPYLTSKQIRTSLDRLEKQRLILSGSFNKSAYDRTKWYAPTCPIGEHDLPIGANEIDLKGEPIPDVNTVDKPDVSPLNPPKGKYAQIPAGVDDEVWKDFIDLRKAKRAPLNATAMKIIEREATKAGWTLNDALSESVARGWQGFKADWVKERTKSNGSRETESMGRTERAAIQALRDLGFAQAAPGASQSGSDALPAAGRNVIAGNQSSPLLTIGYDRSGSGGMVEGGTNDDR